MKDKRINILIELDSFDKGGLQKVVLDSALRFDKEKFKIFIVSIRNTGLLAETAAKNGIKVYNLEKFGNPRLKMLYLAYIILRNKIDISCSHFSHEGYRIYKFFNIPNITFIHNVYAFLSNEMIKKLKSYDELINTYISVSKNATNYAVEKIGLNKDKIVTIPNGIIIEEHEERLKNLKKIKRSDYGLDENDYVFLNVASYNLHKGHYLMAEAMMKILKKRKDIKILCIGNVIVESHVEQYKKYLKENNLENHIIMPGYLTNIESFYDISDAFLLPSFIEGWSIAMNEAMFYEKPMILSNTGGSSEVIENEDIGILLENEYGDITNLDAHLLDYLGYEKRVFQTSDVLAEDMIKFADDRDYWKEAGKKGRNKILEAYDFNKVVFKYEHVISNIISQNNDR